MTGMRKDVNESLSVPVTRWLKVMPGSSLESLVGKSIRTKHTMSGEWCVRWPGKEERRIAAAFQHWSTRSDIFLLLYLEELYDYCRPGRTTVLPEVG